MTVPNVGDSVRFSPSAFIKPDDEGDDLYSGQLPYQLDGRIVYVNREHRYYIAEALLFGHKLRETFKY